MSDVERIVWQNWQRRKWAEEMAAAKKREARYERYRNWALLSAVAAGAGIVIAAVMGHAGMRFGALVSAGVTVLLLALAIVFDELREENAG